LLARYAALRERLPGDRAVRDAAAETFRRLGLPGRRVEAWKYTDLRPIAAASFEELLSVPAGTDRLLHRVPQMGGARLVFANGSFQDAWSTAPASAQFSRFASQASPRTAIAQDGEALLALNTMLAEDGAVIDVPAGVDAGLVQLVSLAEAGTGTVTHFHPRHLIRLAAGARLTIFEISLGEGTYLHGPVTEVQISGGATLTHIRLQEESSTAFHLSGVYAEIAEGATYDAFTLNLGGRLVRTEIHTDLAAPRGSIQLNAAQLLAGTQHADITTVVRHNAPLCSSRQTVRNVLGGRARGVFQGRIEVARHAQKTDGYQMSQALLLSPDAEIDTKPELEIFADDVKCSHGATVGELDAEQLFYLRSRGIEKENARAILVRAFLEEVWQTIADGPSRAALEAALEAHWERGVA